MIILCDEKLKEQRAKWLRQLERGARRGEACCIAFSTTSEEQSLISDIQTLNGSVADTLSSQRVLLEISLS